MKIPERFDEKTFIRDILAKYAKTAKQDAFDDCIVIDIPGICSIPNLPYVVYSIDHPSCIKRPLPDGMGWRFYGRWIAGCTCSDVIAMGAKVKGFSLDLAMPVDQDLYQIQEIYQGINDIVTYYGGSIEGGNIDINDKLEIVGMSWGIVESSAIVKRVGARVGDFIMITTPIGLGWASYLLNMTDKFQNLPDSFQQFYKEYNLFPTVADKAIYEAASIGAITSGMDLTDGPVEFFYTIVERNNLGVEIYENCLPIPEMLEKAANYLNIPVKWLAFDPGYDTPSIHGYTVAPELWSDCVAIFEKYGAIPYKIGQVIEEPTVRLKTSKSTFSIIPKFWDDQFKRTNLVQRWKTFVQKIYQ
jgi:thiamine-monophosphate kinase